MARIEKFDGIEAIITTNEDFRPGDPHPTADKAIEKTGGFYATNKKTMLMVDSEFFNRLGYKPKNIEGIAKHHASNDKMLKARFAALEAMC